MRKSTRVRSAPAVQPPVQTAAVAKPAVQKAPVVQPPDRTAVVSQPPVRTANVVQPPVQTAGVGEPSLDEDDFDARNQLPQAPTSPPKGKAPAPRPQTPTPRPPLIPLAPPAVKKKHGPLYWIAVTLGILIIIGIVISAAVVLDVAHSLSASHGDVKIAYTTETYPASSGEEILIVNMTIQSEGASGFYVNPLNFNLTTGGTSYSYDSSTFELASVLPDDVTLQSNGTTSGAIAFLIPSGSSRIHPKLPVAILLQH